MKFGSWYSIYSVIVSYTVTYVLKLITSYFRMISKEQMAVGVTVGLSTSESKLVNKYNTKSNDQICNVNPCEGGNTFFFFYIINLN
jgi:hypothetical protein